MSRSAPPSVSPIRSPFIRRVQVSFEKTALSQKKWKLPKSAAIGAASDARSVIGAGGYHTKKSRPGGLSNHPAFSTFRARGSHPANPEGRPKRDRQNTVFHRRGPEADL